MAYIFFGTAINVDIVLHWIFSAYTNIDTNYGFIYMIFGLCESKSDNGNVDALCGA